MNCQQCNAELQPGATFCPNCGAQVASQPQLCRFCGQPLAPNAVYCSYCRQPQYATPGAPAAAPAAPAASFAPQPIPAVSSRPRAGMFTALKNYAKFSGRATRTEYWLFYLFQFIISLVFSGLYGLIGAMRAPFGVYIALLILQGLFCLAMLLPNIAVIVRRFHDQGRSGAMILLGLIPFAGPLILFIFMLLPSQPYDNRFGPY